MGVSCADEFQSSELYFGSDRRARARRKIPRLQEVAPKRRFSGSCEAPYKCTVVPLISVDESESVRITDIADVIVTGAITRKVCDDCLSQKK